MKTIRTSLRNSVLEDNQIKTGIYSQNAGVTDIIADEEGNAQYSSDNGQTFKPVIKNYLKTDSTTAQTVRSPVNFNNIISALTFNVSSSGQIKSGLGSDVIDNPSGTGYVPAISLGDTTEATLIKSSIRPRVRDNSDGGGASVKDKKIAYTDDSISQFTQDATHRTVTDTEKATWNGKATASDVVNLIYPVGALYMSLNNVNPGTFLGGTWTRVNQNGFLIGITTTNNAGMTTGSSQIILTAANLPSHSHTFTPSGSLSAIGDSFLHGYFVSGQSQPRITGNTGAGGFAVDAPATEYSGQNRQNGYAMDVLHLQAHNHTFTGSQGTTSNVGSGTAIENNPVRFNVYLFQRTA